MSIYWLVMGLPVLALVIYLIIIYNGLIRLKHNVSNAWANIDVLLKQRHDEIPKLVKVCKRYLEHEQDTLTQIMNIRSQAFDARTKEDIEQLGDIETGMRQALSKLFGLVENYPELKADKQFKHLQSRITALENQIADRREHYNESVTNNNIRIESVPDVWVAKLFGFQAKELLEFSDTSFYHLNNAIGWKKYRLVIWGGRPLDDDKLSQKSISV